MSETRTNATAPPTISGYSHLAIVVTDLEAARRFYVDLLGFTELRRPDFGVPGMWLRVGDLQLHFIEHETMPVAGPGFPTSPSTCRATGGSRPWRRCRPPASPSSARPTSATTSAHRVRAAFVTDPAGNVVELTDVGPLA